MVNCISDIENSKDQRSDRTDEDEEETFAVPTEPRTCGPKNSTSQSAGRGGSRDQTLGGDIQRHQARQGELVIRETEQGL